MKDHHKLSLTHRLKLREAELDERRHQIARHKAVLVLALLERAVDNAYRWLVQVETEATFTQGSKGRFRGFFSSLFGKNQALGLRNLDEVFHSPAVQVARMQYERLVAEHAVVARCVGADVVRAIRGEAATDDTAGETALPAPAPTNGRGSRWG